MEHKTTIQRFEDTLRKYYPEGFARIKPSRNKGDRVDHIPDLDSDFFRQLLASHVVHDFDWTMQDNPQTTLFGTLLSSSAILEIMRAEKGQWDSDRYNFIPLAREQDPVYLLFNNKDGPDYGRIYIYAPAMLIFEPESVYDSIESFLGDQIKYYESGALEYDRSGDMLWPDLKKAGLISKSNNPLSEFWKKTV